MKPGVFRNIDIEEYHSGPGISKSGLTKYMRSPAHYIQYMKERDEPKTQQKLDNLRFGSMTHLAVLEPEKFAQVNVFEGKQRRGNAWDAFLAENGRDYLLDKEVEIVSDMAKAVYAHPRANALLRASGVVEESCFWYDKSSGELCKTRPDKRRFDGLWIDYKTCMDASQRGFSRSIADYGYHIQAAMAKDGYKENGIDLTHFFFICQEKEAPYNVEVYYLSERAVALGQYEYQEALLNLAQSKIEKSWHGYTDHAMTEIDLPEWKYKGE